MTAEYMIQLAAAFAGALGYAIIFHLRKELTLIAAAGGMLSWLVYLFCRQVLSGIFFPTLLAGACGALYAEILARVLKAPSSLFFMVAMIPLVPGRTLYYSLNYAVDGNLSMAGEYGFDTFLCALGIGAGMSVAWALCDLSRKIQTERKERRQ